MIAQSTLRRLIVQFALLASSLTISSVWRSAPSLAQIVPDQTLGAEATQVSPNVTVDDLPTELIEGGAVRGSTLFHSFQDFNVAEFQRVYFANPNGIETILSRVTGSRASSILGTLGVTGAADLFLLNPNGIVFGPNAQLDVAGSFMASTADRFILGENQAFSAVDPNAPPLLTVNVTPGLQYGATQQGVIENQARLRVGTGETLTLLGDTVTHQGGLTAPLGTVEILGNYVSLDDQAQVDTSGASGGGTVRIGGAFQGQGAVPTALRTYIGPDVQIRADAIATGNGGDVTVWADEITGFYGSISAQGAELGQGGLVEVSGHEHLIFRGAVNTSAVNGQMGTLLLDPTDITIANGAGDSGADGTNTFAGNVSATPGSILSTPLSAINDTAPTTLFESELETLSGNTNVILQATNNIAIADLADNALTFSAGSGTIQFTADADQDGAGSVFVNDLNDRIVTNGRDFSASGASITLGRINTSRNGGSGGDIILNATGAVNTRSLQTASQNAVGDGEGGDITVEAGTDITINDDFTGSGNYALVQTRSQNAGGNGRGGTVTFDAGRDINVSATTTVNRNDAEQTNLTTRLFDTAVDDTGGNSLGGAVTLSADRDISLASTTTVNSVEDNNNREDIRITARTELFNTSADDPGTSGNSVGGDVSVVAGRNLNIDGQQSVTTTIQGGRVDVVAIAPILTGISTAASGGDNGLTVGQVQAGNVDLQATGGTINVNLTNTQTTRFENVSVLEGRIDLQPRIEVINASSRNAEDDSTSFNSTGGTVRLDAGGDINFNLNHNSLAQLIDNSVLNNNDGYRMGVETRLVNASAQGANDDSTGGNVQGGEIQLTLDGNLNVSVQNQADTQFEGANIVRNSGDDDVVVRVFTNGFNASATGADDDSTNQNVTGGNITLAAGEDSNISITHIANQSINPSNTTSRIDDFTVESTVANLFSVSAAGAGEDSRSGAVQGGSIHIQPGNNTQIDIQHNLTNTLNTVEIIDEFEVDPDVDNLFNASARRQIGDDRSLATGTVTGGSIQANQSGDFNIGINASVTNSLSDTTILRNIFDPTRNNALQVDIDSSIMNASGRGAGGNGTGSNIQGGEIDLNVAGDLDIRAQYFSSFSGIPIQELQINTEHTVLDTGSSNSDRRSLGGNIALDVGGNAVITPNTNVIRLNGVNVTNNEQLDISDDDGDVIAFFTSADENRRSRTIDGNRQPVSLDGTSGNVSVDAGGNIYIDGQVRTLADENGGGSFAGDITFNAGGDITLTRDIRADAEDTDGRGAAGDVNLISGGNITTSNIIARTQETFDSATAGNVFLQAEGNIQTGDIETYSILDVSTEANLTGDGGDIILSSRNGNVILNDVNVQADALGNGDGGDIEIEGNNVTVNRTEVRTTAAGAGTSGQITINADNRVDLRSGRLFTFVDLGATIGGTPRRGEGGITINADTVALDDFSFIDTATFGERDAGDVLITANTISLDDSSSIFSITAGEGAAGSIELDAGQTGSVTLRDRSSVSTAVNATSTGSGSQGGSVTVSTGSLSLTGGSQITALTRGDGEAGDVYVTATDLVEISGIGTGNYRSGIFTSSDELNSGEGGDITVEADTMRITDGGVLSAQTLGQAGGGDIDVNVRRLELHNGGQMITTAASDGAAGDIEINAAADVIITGSNPAVLGTPELPPRSNVPINDTPAIALNEGEENNNDFDNAVSLNDDFFSLDSEQTNPNIELSSRIPYVAVSGSLSSPSDSSQTTDVDFYSFEVIAGTRAIFDIDTGQRDDDFDVEITLYSPARAELFTVNVNDDSPFYLGAGGSVAIGNPNTPSDSIDPYRRFVFTEPGTYYFSVGVGDDADNLDTLDYTLNVSLNTPNVVGVANVTEEGSGLFAQTTGAGDAGNVTLNTARLTVNNRGQILASTESSGRGGNVNVAAGGGVSVRNNSQISASTTGAGAGGNVGITADENVLIANSSRVSASTGSSGRGGNVDIEAGTAIALATNSQVSVQASGAGQAGSVGLTAPQLELINQSQVTAIAGATNTASAGGSIAVNAAEINLQGNRTRITAATEGSVPAGTLTIAPNPDQSDLTINLADGASISASTTGAGQGGSLEVTAPESITISGNGQLEASTSGTGNAGNVSLRSQRIIVQDRANITASTSGAGDGGNLTVNGSETITIRNNSQLAASTSGAGDAGDVELNTQRLSLFNNSNVSASTSGTGIGGSLTVMAPESVSLDQGSALSVEATAAGGVAGSLSVTTGEMRVANGSEVTVSSPQGQAGNLSILANRLFLDDGRLTALTAVDAPRNQSGANIFIGSAANSLELLFLENESLIQASALGDADGGNITIFADFVIATNPTGSLGSDIIANAERGTGGRIEITTKGLIGIEFRDELTPNNDITVSSQFGLSGTFIQNDLGIDPSRGLTDLPLNLTDPAGLIDRRCDIASTDQASEFVVTGRGGLPPTPDERIDSEVLLPDLGPSEIESDTAPRSSSTHHRRQPTAAEPEVILEPQQWIVDEQGRVQLVVAVANADHAEGAIAVNDVCVVSGEEGL